MFFLFTIKLLIDKYLADNKIAKLLQTNYSDGLLGI